MLDGGLSPVDVDSGVDTGSGCWEARNLRDFSNMLSR